MFVLGGLAFAGIALWIGSEGGAIIMFCVGVVLQAIPSRFTTGELRNKQKRTRADDEKWLRTEGYLPKTRTEAMEDRDARRIAARRFIDPPDGTYYDKDWHVRDVKTDRLIQL